MRTAPARSALTATRGEHRHATQLARVPHPVDVPETRQPNPAEPRGARRSRYEAATTTGPGRTSMEARSGATPPRCGGDGGGPAKEHADGTLRAPAGTLLLGPPLVDSVACVCSPAWKTDDSSRGAPNSGV